MASCLHCSLPVPPRRTGPFCCFGCRVVHGASRPAGADGDRPSFPVQRVQIFAGLFLAVNVMALSFAFYGGDVFGAAAAPPSGSWGSVSELFEYLILFFATVVVATLGLPLFLDALEEGRGRLGWINARTLVCVGVFAAYGLSVWHTTRGSGPIYYDTVTMVLVAITVGKHLEARAKRNAARQTASALEGVPARVEIERDGRRFRLATGKLRAGDLVFVRPGQAIPVDGIVEAGCSYVDASLVTGEPHARSAAAADRVWAGSIAVDGLLRVRAERVDGERLMARVDGLLREALESRFPAMRTADRAARLLAPAVVLIALGVAAAFARAGAPAEGMLRGLSVLLIACPCALAIAPGLIVATAMRRAARRGIVFTSPEAVEKAASLERLFLDKTGTLTGSSSRVDQVHVVDPRRERELLDVLASLGTHSDHPVAQGLQRFAELRGGTPREIAGYRALPGRGVEANVDGTTYRLGGARLLESLGRAVEPGPEVYLVEGDRVVAVVEVRDAPRPDAPRALAELDDLGVRTAALSGDGVERSRALGAALGIPIEGGLLPGDKVDRVRAATGGKGAVGMVGDGLNDAAALAAADVGFAVASATDLAKQAGEVLLLRDRLTLLPDAVAIARDARRRLALSLAWAGGYNAIGVALAVSGRLHPAFAATAMAVSSLVVIAFSRRAGALPGDAEREPAAAAPLEAGA